MMLVLMLMVLMLGGAMCWLIAQRNPLIGRWIALISVITAFSIPLVWFFVNNPVSEPGNDWYLHYQVNMLPAYGINFHLAMDGLSFILLMLTFLLGTLAVLSAWKEVPKRTGLFFCNLLWTLAGIAGVFVAMDLLLFFIFWELMLVPLNFLIAIWGDNNRRAAARKFLLFTQAGALLLLLSVLAMYFIYAQQNGGNYTFDYFALLNTTLNDTTARLIMMGFMLAFVIKLPMVPLQSWLPTAHSEAPAAGSLILAGLLLKTSAYGIMRLVMPMFPQATADISWLAMLFGVIGIVYGALMAFKQTDLRRLIAYTSISHMGFVLLGVFASREIGLQGVVIQLMTHGVSTGALFVMAGLVKERLKTRDISQMGDVWTAMPHMSPMAMLLVMASLGLPFLGNFIAEFMILISTFTVSPVLTIMAGVGLVLSAVYSLRLIHKVFLGQMPSLTEPTRDLSAREWVTVAALTVAIIILGLYPQPVIDMVSGVVTGIASNR